MPLNPVPLSYAYFGQASRCVQAMDRLDRDSLCVAFEIEEYRPTTPCRDSKPYWCDELV